MSHVFSLVPYSSKLHYIPFHSRLRPCSGSPAISTWCARQNIPVIFSTRFQPDLDSKFNGMSVLCNWNVVICSKTSIEATMSSDKHMSFAPTWRWLCLDCLQLVYGPLQRSDYNTALFPFLRLFGSVIYETRSPFTSKSSRHGLRRCTTAKVILWARNDLELITLPKRLQIAIFIIDVPTKRYKSRTTKSSRG